jgi:hypothetical protein
MNYTFEELKTIVKKIEEQGFADENTEEVKVFLAPNGTVGYNVYKVYYGNGKRAAYTSLYTFNELNAMLRE